MFTLKEHITVKNLQEAYELLNQNKNNVILGGLLWLKMGRKNYNIGIDISRLALNTIIETESTIEIGCMTTLRQIETSDVLNTYFHGILPKSVKNIVGVQFRNCATVGGSVYSRFGFSDFLTSLLVLDSYVHMYQGGVIPLEQFVDMPYKKDILVKLIIKKDGCRAAYQSQRMTATDLPVLVASVSLCNDKWKIAVGARPCKAKLAYEASKLLSLNPTNEEIEVACNCIVNDLSFGTNQRGTAEYRKVLAKVLVMRGIKEICK